MRRIREILRLRHETGLSGRAIARALAVSNSTVAGVFARAELAGLAWPLPEGITDAELEERLYRERYQAVAGAREPDWAAVHAGLAGKRMVLAFSRHLFCYPVLRMTQGEFLAAHVAAFAFFDGCPQRLVPDNLGSGVLRPDLYDPRLNRGYAELSHHYGCLDPAHAGRPKDKPRVERMVPYVRDSFFSGRQFFMRTPSWCRHRAKEIGPAASALVTGLLGEQALHRLRSAQGVVHLADSYGAARLELACALALEVGDGSYRTVRGILKAGREQLAPEEEITQPLAPAHLHGPDSLFAHLEA